VSERVRGGSSWSNGGPAESELSFASMPRSARFYNLKVLGDSTRASYLTRDYYQGLCHFSLRSLSLSLSLSLPLVPSRSSSFPILRQQFVLTKVAEVRLHIRVCKLIRYAKTSVPSILSFSPPPPPSHFCFLSPRLSSSVGYFRSCPQFFSTSLHRIQDL
jgi:hypothetical protein